MNKIECEKAVGEICKMCFDKHELEYGHQPVNCAWRAFDNEDCPMITTLKKLIQEHFEEKQETNLEHYYDDLLKIGCSTFGVSDGKIKNCNCTACSQCEIRALDKKEYCRINAIKWLASPYKKPAYKLTKFENDLLQSYVEGHLRKYKFKDLIFLNGMKEKGHFKGVDENATIGDILGNCEVIK